MPENFELNGDCLAWDVETCKRNGKLVIYIGKACLPALFGFSLFLTACQGYCSISPSTCGPTDVYIPQRQQLIDAVKWSPDGKKLAFTYQNGYDSNFNFSLYTVNSDGTQLKKLLETNTKNLSYILHQWAPQKNLLTGDAWNLYDVDEQGLQKQIFSQAPEKMRGFVYKIEGACHLSDSQYVVIRHNLPFPNWLELLNTDTGAVSQIKVEQPQPFTEKSSLGDVKCLPFENRLYLAQHYTRTEQNEAVATYAVGKLRSDSGEIGDIAAFKSLVSSIELINDGPYFQIKDGVIFKFLGADAQKNLVYSLSQHNVIQSVQAYNLESKEAQERPDIKVLGEFSPEFQKVAFWMKKTW